MNIFVISTEKIIDFDIMDDCVVSRSLASFLISEFRNTDNRDYRNVLSRILILAERNSVIGYMRPITVNKDRCLINISFNIEKKIPAAIVPDKFTINLDDYYKNGNGAASIHLIDNFSLSNVHIKIEQDLFYLTMSIDGAPTPESIEYANTIIQIKKLRKAQLSFLYGFADTDYDTLYELHSDEKPVKWCTYNDSIEIPGSASINTGFSPEELKEVATMYDVSKSTKILPMIPELCSYMESRNTLKYPAKFFKVKDARVSKDRTIIFWEDGSKTIIKKAEVEKDFDLEKAIMAAFTRRALSFGHTAKERSVDETIDNIAGMINDHLDYEEAKRNKPKQKQRRRKK